MAFDLPVLDDTAVVAARPPKNDVRLDRPYAYFVEEELSFRHRLEPVATIFLTNHECPFRCVMCDLWKNTLDQPTPPGAIVEQVRFALQQLPPARIVKLYNSGNFFDRKAIPPSDRSQLAGQLRGFDQVIVENHPRLCGDVCLEFRDRLEGRLEIALGLETVHPELLAWLNKRMTLDDFSRAARFLTASQISVRSFVLLRPPGMSGPEGVEWAVRSVDYAVEQGVTCCAIVPTRDGNGVMEMLREQGHFQPPTIGDMETALTRSLQRLDCEDEHPPSSRPRVMMDLWDAAQFGDCNHCINARIERLAAMNRSQRVEPEIECPACEGDKL